MKNWKLSLLIPMIALAAMGASEGGCDSPRDAAPTSDSGVSKQSTKVEVGGDGLTMEQRNVSDRLREDNKPGSIKHLYVISPYSGQVLLYSPVRGKVTSGGKRLSPTTVKAVYRSSGWYDGFLMKLGLQEVTTQEVLQDDGTYGHSGDYLFWWDLKGIYHQHYLTGGQIVHVASAPIAVKDITINIEKQEAPK